MHHSWWKRIDWLVRIRTAKMVVTLNTHNSQGKRRTVMYLARSFACAMLSLSGRLALLFVITPTRAAASPPAPTNMLIDAAFNGDVPQMQQLLKLGVPVNGKNQVTRQGALYCASANGHVTACRLLLDNGARINEKFTLFGMTALHIACKKGHTDVVELLLERGANIYGKNIDRKTAIDLISDNDNTTKELVGLYRKVSFVGRLVAWCDTMVACLQHFLDKHGLTIFDVSMFFYFLSAAVTKIQNQLGTKNEKKTKRTRLW